MSYILKAFDVHNSGIFIPKLFGLSIGDLAEYTVMQHEKPIPSDIHWEKIPLRPGEKMHEELLTIEECSRASDSNPDDDEVKEFDDYFILRPSTVEYKRQTRIPKPYFSDTAPQLTKHQLLRILADD